MKPTKLCTKCVLPDTTPGISFDHNGICNYCTDHIPMKVEGEPKLREIFKRFKALNKKYDCMLCISGGRDSTYALWKLVHDYNLKVLAVNYKNPFTSEQAKINLKRVIEELKVDFIDWEFPKDNHCRATARALKAWSYNPSSSLIPIVCAHCKSTWPDFFRIAKENDVALIVIGSNPLETASFKKAGLGGARTYHKISNLPKLLKKTLTEIIKNPRYLTHCSWPVVIKMYFQSSHSSPYLRNRYKNINVVRLFDYLTWNEKEVMTTITKNLPWKQSPESDSPWRFDCRLDFARRLMYAATIGVTELRDLFSKMIREGMMTREEAINRLKTEDVVSISATNNELSKIGFQLSDLNLDIDKSLLKE